VACLACVSKLRSAWTVAERREMTSSFLDRDDTVRHGRVDTRGRTAARTVVLAVRVT